MVAKKITSLQHPLVKHWVEVRTNKTYREKAQRVLISGEKMVREQKIESLIALEPNSTIQCKEMILVTEPILKKITGLNQPDGFAAEVLMPSFQPMEGKNFLLVLDEIADPGNLGTLLRTALALGWEGVIATPRTVDFFNDKAIRAGKGAHFHMPLARLTLDEIAQLDVQFYMADLEGKALESSIFEAPLALILSNEGRGAGKRPKLPTKKITIPMTGKMESLNVASSGAILLYAMRQI